MQGKGAGREALRSSNPSAPLLSSKGGPAGRVQRTHNFAIVDEVDSRSATDGASPHTPRAGLV